MSTVCELENGHLVRGFSQLDSMVIFHSYVNLPGGICYLEKIALVICLAMEHLDFDDLNA